MAQASMRLSDTHLVVIEQVIEQSITNVEFYLSSPGCKESNPQTVCWFLWFYRGDGVVGVCHLCGSACASVQNYDCSFYANLL